MAENDANESKGPVHEVLQKLSIGYGALEDGGKLRERLRPAPALIERWEIDLELDNDATVQEKVIDGLEELVLLKKSPNHRFMIRAFFNIAESADGLELKPGADIGKLRGRILKYRYEWLRDYHLAQSDSEYDRDRQAVIAAYVRAIRADPPKGVILAATATEHSQSLLTSAVTGPATEAADAVSVDVLDTAPTSSGGLAVPPVADPLLAAGHVTPIVPATLRRKPRYITPDERLDQVATKLAETVRHHWQAEERNRQLHDPFPLPVTWTNAPESLVDYWEHICGVEGDVSPLDLRGSVSDVQATYDAVPSGRLVILGKGGAGKSVALIRLALALLDPEGWRPDQPVPIIFRIASWDPNAASLRSWMSTEMAAAHPKLMRSTPDLAARLIQTGRVLPMFDGFDEVKSRFRADALQAINAEFDTNEPFALTSRSEEYAMAVDAGDVLTAAAAVQLEDLTLDLISSYLPRTTRKVVEGHQLTDKWSPVLERLRNSPTGAAETRLLGALTTPLMVSLARSIYSETAADPTELIDADRFPGVLEVQEHLFDKFVEVAYSHKPSDDSGAQNARPWSAESARKWLGFLAMHIHGQATDRFEPFHLRRAVARIPVSHLLTLFVSMIWIVIYAGIQVFSTEPAHSAPLPVIVFVSMFGVLNLRLPRLGREHRLIPPSRALRWPRVRRALLTASALGALAGMVPLGLMALSSASSAIRESSIAVWPAVSVGVGFLIFFGELFKPRPIDIHEPAVVISLAGNRFLAVALAVQCSAISFAIQLLVAWRLSVHSFSPPMAGVVAIVMGGTTLLFTTWGLWLDARLSLALGGYVPYRLMAFLEDALERDVLRLADGKYQFRHALLQDYLAYQVAMGWLGRTTYNNVGEFKSSIAHSVIAIQRIKSGADLRMTFMVSPYTTLEFILFAHGIDIDDIAPPPESRPLVEGVSTKRRFWKLVKDYVLMDRVRRASLERDFGYTPESLSEFQRAAATLEYFSEEQEDPDYADARRIILALFEGSPVDPGVLFSKEDDSME